jgi:hypothetical protein
MNDQELRALGRDAVARHMGGGHAAPLHDSLPVKTVEAHSAHPSHGVYLAVVNATDACVIEPSVHCDHCGYCKSHGH